MNKLNKNEYQKKFIRKVIINKIFANIKIKR